MAEHIHEEGGAGAVPQTEHTPISHNEIQIELMQRMGVDPSDNDAAEGWILAHSGNYRDIVEGMPALANQLAHDRDAVLADIEQMLRDRLH
ncbi:MAG: hypothetical protein ABIG71_02570 [Candidatus Uhrbacteria bacterium]